MQIPNKIAKTGVALEDQYFDLKGLSAYSSLGLSTLRTMIREHGLPHFRVCLNQGQVGKILIRKSEFDRWIEKTYRAPLDDIVNDIMTDLCGNGRTQQ